MDNDVLADVLYKALVLRRDAYSKANKNSLLSADSSPNSGHLSRNEVDTILAHLPQTSSRIFDSILKLIHIKLQSQ